MSGVGATVESSVLVLFHVDDNGARTILVLTTVPVPVLLLGDAAAATAAVGIVDESDNSGMTNTLLILLL